MRERSDGERGLVWSSREPYGGEKPDSWLLADSSRSRFWLLYSGQIDIESIDFLGAGIAQNQGRAVRRETGLLAERTGSAPDTLEARHILHLPVADPYPNEHCTIIEIDVPPVSRPARIIEVSLRQLCPLFHPEIVPERDCARVYGVFDHGTLIAVQNGTSPGRVVAFDLDPSLTRVTSETIIERSTKTLGDPTHGVIIDDDFYYFANSGWDVIDDQGNMRPGGKTVRAALHACSDAAQS